MITDSFDQMATETIRDHGFPGFPGFILPSDLVDARVELDCLHIMEIKRTGPGSGMR